MQRVFVQIKMEKSECSLSDLLWPLLHITVNTILLILVIWEHMILICPFKNWLPAWISHPAVLVQAKLLLTLMKV